MAASLGVSKNRSQKGQTKFLGEHERQGRPLTAVVREAVDYFIDHKMRGATNLERTPTTSKPRLRRCWRKEVLG
jgi:hypothetical protein